MDSLNDYARAIETALKRKKSYSAYNRDMVHAKIVVTMAFRTAKKLIRLLSHQLDPDLYASNVFIEEARKFVATRNGRVDILVETDVSEDHPLMQLAQEFPDNVEIRRVPDVASDEYVFNFMIFDEAGYRFEYDRKDFKAQVIAHETSSEIFNGNMKTLGNIFRHLKESAEPIGL